MKRFRSIVVGLLVVLLSMSSMPFTVMADELQDEEEIQAGEIVDVSTETIETTDVVDAYVFSEIDDNLFDEVEILPEEFIEESAEAVETTDVFDDAYAFSEIDDDLFDEVESIETYSSETDESLYSDEEIDAFDVSEENFFCDFDAEADYEYPIDIEKEPNEYDVSMLADSHSGKCGDNAYYELRDEDDDGVIETLIISGSGDMYDYEMGQPWYWEQITDLRIEDGITSIGDQAFIECSYLKNIVFPNTLVEIGFGAFYRCDRLVDLEIPDGVVSIGDYAFATCESLTNVKIPGSLTTLSYRMFYNCCLLSSVELSEGVISIDGYAFADCSSLTSIEMPEGITDIYDGAFESCSALERVRLPDSITCFGDSVFYNCTSLSSISVSCSFAQNLTMYSDILELRHVYDSFSDNFYDDECNICGYSRTLNKCGDNAYYELFDMNKDGKFETLVISGFSDMDDWDYSTNAPWYEEKDDITNVIVEYGITHIGEGAFRGFVNLSDVSLPNSLTSIGNSSFLDCKILSCVDLPDNVTSIGDYAFYGCYKLKSIQIPNGVTIISPYTFCSTGLSNVEIPEGVTTIKERAFENCYYLTSVDIPDSVTCVGNYAFYNCNKLTKITAPCCLEKYMTSNISVLDLRHTFDDDDDYVCNVCGGARSQGKCGENAYYELLDYDKDGIRDCLVIDGTGDMYDWTYSEHSPWYGNSSDITSITIRSGVTSIGNYAFTDCTKLRSVYISDSVTSVGSFAFMGCDNLGSITLPNSVTSIGSYAFSNCQYLVSVVMPDNLKKLGIYAFQDCTNLTEIVIPKGLKEIGEGTFRFCKRLASITISKNVEIIGAYAFAECYALSDLEIQDGVKHIDYGVFENCSSLRSVALPDSVKYIGGWVFYGCKELNHISLPCGLKQYSNNLRDYSNKLDWRHIYDNACDANCNICGLTRSVPAHRYKNDCDKDCDVCGYVRVTKPHIYTDDCDTTCNICYAKRSVSGHVYDNACDELCNICYAIRSVPGHVYDNSCDTECNVCKAPRMIFHKYDNACDATCNVCGEVRLTSHKYSNACDATCDLCGAVRSVSPHVYSNETDEYCDICGYKRVISTPTPKPVPTTIKEDGIESFAERLYTTCLGRAAEPSGKAYWASQLKSGKSGAEVARGFFFSAELTNKNISDVDFIMRLYRTFMGREADIAGLTYWINQMNSGKDRMYVFNGFVNSTEWANICLKYGIVSGGTATPTYVKPASQPVIDFATRMYTTCLGRAADQSGRDYWALQLSNMKKTGTEVAYDFFFSKEFKNKHLSDKEFITRLYRTFMGREPDDGGYTYWLNQMKAGKTREDVFYGFSTSKEFAGLCAKAGILA